MKEGFREFLDKLTAATADAYADVSDCVEDNARGAAIIASVCLALGALFGAILF